MVFTVDGKRSYRNPHCALCNQEGWLIPQKSNSPGISNVDPPYTPPLRILLDVSPNVKFTTESREKSQPTINTEAPRFQVFNMSSQVLNCTSTGINNCTCQALILANNQSSRVSLSSNKTLVTLTSSRISYDNDFLRLQGNDVSNLCPTAQPGPLDALTKYENDNLVLVHITFAAMILSIVSLCFLLAVYLSFKELRNLPGRCVINLSGALLCYQAFFLSAKKSTEVPILCQAVAILIHFFALSAFSWMAVMAFDTASTFTPTGKWTLYTGTESNPHPEEIPTAKAWLIVKGALTSCYVIHPKRSKQSPQKFNYFSIPKSNTLIIQTHRCNSLYSVGNALTWPQLVSAGNLVLTT